MQKDADRVQAGAQLVVAFDDDPRRVRRVGAVEHLLRSAGVVVPTVDRGAVDGRELPVLQRMDLAFAEALQLLFAGNGEPELDERDAASDEASFKVGDFAHEVFVLFLRAEAHDGFNPGAVVPGAVEEDEFALRREVRHIALEVPLSGFDVRGFGQSHHARAAGIQVLHEAADRAALPGRVAAFKEDHDLAARFLHPALELQEFHLQVILLLFVERIAHAVDVGIFALAPVLRELVHVVGNAFLDAAALHFLVEKRAEHEVAAAVVEVFHDRVDGFVHRRIVARQKHGLHEGARVVLVREAQLHVGGVLQLVEHRQFLLVVVLLGLIHNGYSEGSCSSCRFLRQEKTAVLLSL